MTKQNYKLEAKFFQLFRVLYPINKQTYKLELPRKWRIYNIFHESLPEQNNTRKREVNKIISQLKLDKNNNKEYEIEAICNSKIYARKIEDHLPSLYYLVF